MMAIGEDELGAPVKKGDLVTNSVLSGTVEYGTDASTGKECGLLGFISCEDKQYLVSIAGKLLSGWRIEND